MIMEPEKESITKNRTAVIDLDKVMKHKDSELKFEDILKQCSERKLNLLLYGKNIEADWLYKVYQMMNEIHYKELKTCQQTGIKRALKRKEEGVGSYGRPCIALPKDFETQIKIRILNHESLSTYRKEIGIKSSTFYKWVNVYKETWTISESKKKIHLSKES